MSKQAADDIEFVKLLEDGVRAVLRDKQAKMSDRLKAVEIGSKLLAIRHKIDGADDSGSFFTKPG